MHLFSFRDITSYLSKDANFLTSPVSGASVEVTPSEFQYELSQRKTGVAGLLCGVCLIICLAGLIEYRFVTDRQTDRQTDTETQHIPRPYTQHIQRRALTKLTNWLSLP